MELFRKEFGEYRTNCYILKTHLGEFIIDPGMDSTEWVVTNIKNPLALLNTHGHFDHIWCNAELKKKFPATPLICPKGDCFMLENDCFNLGLTPCLSDIKVVGDEVFYFDKNGITKQKDSNAIKVEFMFFPGHTPGCSMIKIDEFIFSGDFIFKHSIGKYDFPYSSPNDMKKSLQKFAQIPYDMTLYPGHGESTSIKKEQLHAETWIRSIG